MNNCETISLLGMGRLVAVAGASFAFLIAGCGGGASPSNDSPTFDSSGEVRDALVKAGLDCAEYEIVDVHDRQMGTDGAVDVAKCYVENEHLSLIVWKDNGQRDNYTGMEKAMGCAMGGAFGKSTFDLVMGDRWTIDDTSQTLATQIADAVGGRPEHISCSK